MLLYTTKSNFTGQIVAGMRLSHTFKLHPTPYTVGYPQLGDEKTVVMDPDTAQSEPEKKKIRRIMADYDRVAEQTSLGKYRCRDCGMLFDTLEEHYIHYRRMHWEK